MGGEGVEMAWEVRVMAVEGVAETVVEEIVVVLDGNPDAGIGDEAVRNGSEAGERTVEADYKTTGQENLVNEHRVGCFRELEVGVRMALS